MQGALSTMQGSLSTMQGSLSTMQGSLSTMKDSLSTMQGSLQADVFDKAYGINVAYPMPKKSTLAPQPGPGELGETS